MIGPDLMDEIRRGFALPLDGIHGEAHWARVCETGLRLAGLTGADAQIVELFAYLHDAKRADDGWDREHGQRAAELARSLARGARLDLPEGKLEMLAYACTHHSEGLTEADVTVQICWDADRLDLGRIGIYPDVRRLCTAEAKDGPIVEWAFQRSLAGRAIGRRSADPGTREGGE